MNNVSQDRLTLENHVTDLDIHVGDLRDEIQHLLVKYREARHMRRIARSRLEFCLYIEAVEHAFGNEVAEIVRDHARRAA